MKPLRILALGPWFPANSFTFLTAAFEKTGCEVFRAGPPYFSHYDLTWPSTDLPLVDLPLPRQAPLWHLPDLVDLCTRERGAPDLVFVGEETYQTSIETTDQVPVVLYSADGWKNSFARYDLFRPVAAFTNHPYGVRPEPRTEEDPRWSYLPGACFPPVHKNLRHSRPYDFALFGTWYKGRGELCEYLRRQFAIAYGQVTTAGYVEAYNSALTTLHQTGGQHEVKWRFFENMACGTCVMSDYTKLLPRLGYERHVHYFPLETVTAADGEVYSPPEVVAAGIRRLKENPDLRLQIAEAGWRQTIRFHSYYHRLLAVAWAVGLDSLAAQAQAAIEQVWHEHGL